MVEREQEKTLMEQQAQTPTQQHPTHQEHWERTGPTTPETVAVVEPVVVGSMVAEAETVVQVTQEVPVDVQDQTTRPAEQKPTVRESLQEEQAQRTTLQD